MTAIEWLKKELEEYGSSSHLSLDWSTFDELCEQAKEMEKQQIIDACVKGFCISAEGFNGEYGINDFNNIKEEISAEQYYTETYGSKGSDEHIVDTNEMIKDINYWKNNCEEDYITTPISVLRYISELEKLITSSQTEISDEEITKLANEHILYNDSKRQWVVEGMKLYIEQLKTK